MADDFIEPFDASRLLGQVLDGRYRLDSVLGQGGMGMVFSATQTSMDRQVAVKALHPSLAVAPMFFERFKREAEVISRLKHPNIVTVFDFGRTASGVCYYVMEKLEGRSLRQQVKADGPMSLRRAAAIAEQVALGLGHAHKQNVIHRDMKPHNVMTTVVDASEYVRVLDFGLVKALEAEGEQQLTSTGMVLGTPQYMPPEQAGGEPVDARSDLYSLGAVFYYCLTGSSPYGATSARRALSASLTQPLPSVASKRVGAPVPHAIEEFLRKAMAREAADRYQTADDFVADLEASLSTISPEVLDARPLQGPDGAPTREGSGSHSGARQRAGASSASRARPLPRASQAIRPPEPHDHRVTARHQPTAPWPSRAPVAIALTVAALFAVGAAVAVQRRLSRPATAEAVKPALASAPAPGTTEPDAAPARTVVSVTLHSQPPGAEVVEGGVSLGKTPLTRAFSRDGVHRVSLQLPGYQEARKTFQLQTDETFEITMEPAQRKPPTKPPAGKPLKDNGISPFE